MAMQTNLVFGGNLTFNHSTQEWRIFKERFQSMCFANDLTDETDKAGTKRRAILLTTLVEETYRVARDLVFPEVLNKVEYMKLVEKLDSHFESPKCSFAERYNFYKAEQRPGEDLGEWAARVRSLAQFCGFTYELDTALRDRFVLGLENAKEREKLFTESIEHLTFNKALHIAQAVRSARLAMQATDRPGRAATAGAAPAHASGSMRTGPVPTRSPIGSSVLKKACTVCGYNNHEKENCRFAKYTCKKCKTKGHLSRMCKVKDQCNFIAQGSDDLYEGIYDLFTIRCVDSKAMQQVVSIGNERVLCEIDSGSAVSILPANIYRSLFDERFTLQKSHINLSCYNGSKIMPLGCVSLPVNYEKKTESINFFIIATAVTQPPLLGQDFISKFQLHFCSLKCNNLQSEDEVIGYLRSKYSQLFEDRLGKFNQCKVNLKIRTGAEFKFFKPRPVPLALRLRKHADQLLLYKGNDVDCYEYAGDIPILPDRADEESQGIHDDQDSTDSSFTSITSPMGSPHRQSSEGRRETAVTVSPTEMQSTGGTRDGTETELSTAVSPEITDSAGAQANDIVADVTNLRRYPVRSTRNQNINYKE